MNGLRYSAARWSGTLFAALRHIVWCAFFSVLFVTQSSAENMPYRLQPGDELSLSYLGLGPAPHIATIGPSGEIGFPYLGTFYAAGLSLGDLEREIEQAAVGVEVPNLPGRDPPFAVLNAENLFLEISRFRPITIIGQVAQPGAVEFAPGMSVRGAIGAGGGVEIFQGGTAPALEAPAQLRAALELRRLLRASLFKNEILLRAPTSVEDIPEEDVAALSEFLGDEGASAAIEEIGLAISERTLAIQALNTRIELVDQRIERLRAAFDNYSSASVTGEERLARILEMMDRGLTTEETVNNVRLAALAASTRLLTIESDIFGSQSERERLLAEIERTENEYRTDLFSQNQDLNRELSQLEGRIEGLQAVLIGSGGAVSQQVDTSVEVFIYRGSPDAEEGRLAAMNEAVQPGDIIEVRVTMNDD